MIIPLKLQKNTAVISNSESIWNQLDWAYIFPYSEHYCAIYSIENCARKINVRLKKEKNNIYVLMNIFDQNKMKRK